MIELHDVLYVPDISYTLYSIIKNGRQPYLSIVIYNGSTTVGFPTFTLLENTNKEITLNDDPPFKYRHSQTDYINLPNYFRNTTVRLIHGKSAIPTKSTKESASYDLYSVEQVSIKHGETNKINTGVNVQFPQRSFGFVTSRSSMVANHGILVPIVTIYCDYTGQISAVLHNQSKITFSIKEVMRIAQLLIPQVSTPTLHATQSKLVTSRGEGAFGSTDESFRTDITPTAPLLLTPFPPTKSFLELHPTDAFPTESPAPTTSHSKIPYP